MLVLYVYGITVLELYSVALYGIVDKVAHTISATDLVKHTDTTHPDYSPLQRAVESLKTVMK